MPRNASIVRSAISAQFDARGWSGQNLYSLTGTQRTMPTFTEVGEGIYTDVITFLNGHGSQTFYTLADRMLDFWPVSGTTMEVYIGDDDKLVFKSSVAFSVTSSASANQEVFGINPAGQSTVSSGGFYYLYADFDWQRGNIPHDTKLTCIASSTVFTVYFPMYQDIPTACRVTTVDNTLEDIDGSGSRHWGINENGVVWWSDSGNVAPLSWTDLEFMRELGFTGDEIKVSGTYGSYSFATGICKGYACPYRPFAFINPSVVEEVNAKRQDDGDWVGVYTGTYHLSTMKLFIDGPKDACITVTKKVYDMHRHWLRDCMPRLHLGARVTLYQDVGDTRSAGYLTDGAEYSNEVTVEDNGYRGRIDGFVTNNDGMSAITWPKGLRRRAPITITIQS